MIQSACMENIISTSAWAKELFFFMCMFCFKGCLYFAGCILSNMRCCKQSRIGIVGSFKEVNLRMPFETGRAKLCITELFDWAFTPIRDSIYFSSPCSVIGPDLKARADFSVNQMQHLNNRRFPMLEVFSLSFHYCLSVLFWFFFFFIILSFVGVGCSDYCDVCSITFIWKAPYTDYFLSLWL